MAAQATKPRTFASAPDVARRRDLIAVATWVGVPIAFYVVLRLVWNAQEHWATIGLTIAGGALLFCLVTLYRMVRALGTSQVAFDLARTAATQSNSRRALREERRRLLRAINELRFDFEMGKLSEADYKQVREGYELQAVEVMRALQTESTLHPEVASELERLGIEVPGSQTASESESSEAGESSEATEATEAGESSEATEAAESSEASESSSDSEPAPADATDADEGTSVEAVDPPDEDTASPSEDSESPDAANVCASCEGANDLDAKFCKHCGKGLES